MPPGSILRNRNNGEEYSSLFSQDPEVVREEMERVEAYLRRLQLSPANIEVMFVEDLDQRRADDIRARSLLSGLLDVKPLQ